MNSHQRRVTRRSTARKNAATIPPVGCQVELHDGKLAKVMAVEFVGSSIEIHVKLRNGHPKVILASAIKSWDRLAAAA